MKTFKIRPYRLDDVDEVYAAADESREHVGRWMGWMTAGYSRVDAEKWVRQAMASREQDEAYEHVIIDAEDGSIAGACGLNFLNRVNGVCNLGYWVRSSRIGQGAAHQAALLLRNFGFETLGLNRLEIVVAEGNTFSRAVAESTGAIYEGLQRLRLKVGDVAYDAHVYAFLNPDANRVAGMTSPKAKPKIRTVGWIDMIVQDPNLVSRFYTEVVGLSREAVPEDPTHTSYLLRNETDDEILGICDQAVFPDWVQGWLPYIDIDNFDKRVAKVVEAGGVILKQMTMDYRWKGQRFCLVRDPSKAAVMLCEAAPRKA